MPTRTAAILIAVLSLAWPARAQESAPVMVDASPSAAELLRRADEAAAANPGESARLVQQVLDGFARKLVPWPPEPDRYRSAAAAAEDFLRTHPSVLERWLRQEGPVAERAVAAGELVETVRARAGTAAALQAMLSLAQRAMDEGRTFDARAWIARADRHPMADDGLRARLAQARLALEAVDATPRAATPASRAADAGGDWQPLWNTALPLAWFSRVSIDPDTGQPRRNAATQLADGSALASAPRVDGDAVLVADGATVQALDRFGGSVLWRERVGAETDRAPQPLADLAVATPLRDLVVTLPGHAQNEQRSGAPRIVALDRATGRRRWEASLSAMRAPEFEDLFPHGEPVAVGDLVIVQARKSNTRLETAAWLLAFDAADGALRWAVPLGAAGGVRLAASRPLGSPLALGDDVIAASSLGVVARLDGATGETRWLRRWPAPIREARFDQRAWQLPSPVADDRLVAWIAPDAATLVGLDPADGRTLWARPLGPETPRGAARTLLLDRDRLFAIGDDVVAMHRDDPDRVAWSLSSVLGRAPQLCGAASLGTLADGTRALAVPTADEVLLLAPQDGARLGSCPLKGGANTAIVAGQLAACAAQSVSVAMQASEGERVLRERLAASPGDPRRGLALLELGRAWRRPALIEQGASAAAAALGTAPGVDDPVRAQLIERLIDRGTLDAAGDAEADRLLAMAAGLARTPSQRAQVRLTKAGRALARGRGGEAGETLRSIIGSADESLALVQVDAQRQVQAGVLAQRVLAESGDSDAARRIEALRVPVPRPAPARVGELQPAPRSLPGALVLESPEAAQERPAGCLLLQEPVELAMLRGPELAPAWRVPFVAGASTVASWRPALVIWSAAGDNDGRLIAIDPADGAVRFQRQGIGDLFDPHQGESGGDAAEGANLRTVEAFRAGDFLLLQRGDGQTVALRLDGDGRVAWRAAPPVRVVRAADTNAESWAVAGPSGPSDESAAVFVGSVRDGAERFHAAVPDEVGKPQWLRLVPGGVAIGGTGGAAMLDLAPGLPVRWVQHDPRARAVTPMAAAGRWLVQADMQGRLTGLAVDDGELRPGFLQGSQPQSDDAATTAQFVGGQWLVHRLKALTLHGPDGLLEGEAVGAPTRRHDAIAVAGDTVLSSEIVPLDRMREGSQVPQFAVRSMRLGEGLRQQGSPLVVRSDGLRLVGMTAVDGWVLLGGDDRTIAIPAPSAAESPR